MIVCGHALPFTVAFGLGFAVHRTIEVTALDIAASFASRHVAAAGAFGGRHGVTLALAHHRELGGAGRLEADRFAVCLAVDADLGLTHGVGFDVDVAAGLDSGTGLRDETEKSYCRAETS